MYTNLVSIDNDYQAEELIRQIKEEQSEKNRLVDVCKHEIQQYQDKIEELEAGYAKSTENAMFMLSAYCRAKANHKTKTLITYALPSGKLQWKRKDPKAIQDADKLLAFAKKYLPSCVKVAESAQWEEIKKKIELVYETHYETDENGELVTDAEGNPVTTEKPVYVFKTADGEPVAVDGVTLVEQPDMFEVK